MPDSYTILTNTTTGIAAVVRNSKCLAIGHCGFRASNEVTIVANLAGQEITIPCEEIASVNGNGPAPTSAAVLSAIGFGFDLTI